MTPEQIAIRNHLQEARRILSAGHPNFAPLFDLLCACVDANANTVPREGRALFAPTKLVKLAFKLNPTPSNRDQKVAERKGSF